MFGGTRTPAGHPAAREAGRHRRRRAEACRRPQLRRRAAVRGPSCPAALAPREPQLERRERAAARAARLAGRPARPRRAGQLPHRPDAAPRRAAGPGFDRGDAGRAPVRGAPVPRRHGRVRPPRLRRPGAPPGRVAGHGPVRPARPEPVTTARTSTWPEPVVRGPVRPGPGTVRGSTVRVSTVRAGRTRSSTTRDRWFSVKDAPRNIYDQFARPEADRPAAGRRSFVRSDVFGGQPAQAAPNGPAPADRFAGAQGLRQRLDRSLATTCPARQNPAATLAPGQFERPQAGGAQGRERLRRPAPAGPARPAAPEPTGQVEHQRHAPAAARRRKWALPPATGPGDGRYAAVRHAGDQLVPRAERPRGEDSAGPRPGRVPRSRRPPSPQTPAAPQRPATSRPGAARRTTTSSGRRSASGSRPRAGSPPPACRAGSPGPTSSRGRLSSSRTRAGPCGFACARRRARPAD